MSALWQSWLHGDLPWLVLTLGAYLLAVWLYKREFLPVAGAGVYGGGLGGGGVCWHQYTVCAVPRRGAVAHV